MTQHSIKQILADRQDTPRLIRDIARLMDAADFTLRNIVSENGSPKRLTQVKQCKEDLKAAIAPFEDWYRGK